MKTNRHVADRWACDLTLMAISLCVMQRLAYTRLMWLLVCCHFWILHFSNISLYLFISYIISILFVSYTYLLFARHAAVYRAKVVTDSESSVPTTFCLILVSSHIRCDKFEEISS